jgi:replicative DNA helicase
MIAAKNTYAPVERLKVPPHSIEAEQSVLGSILIMQKADRMIGEIMDLLNPDMFYNLSHQIIFEAMVKIGPMNEIDVVTVDELLENTGKIEEAGGISYLGEISRNTPSSANALAYCEIIKERYLKRRIIGDLHNSIEALYNGESASDVLSMIERNVSGIDLGGAYEPTHLNTKIGSFVNLLESRVKNEVKAIGLKTGIRTLDEQIGGIKPNWLVVLAGRPSMGKTIIAQLINSHISRTLPSLFFTMEMGSDEIMDRYIGILAGVNVKNLTSGELTDYEWSRTHQAIDSIRDDRFKIYYDETPALALNQIRYRVKSAIKKLGKIGLVTIDYLGLMKKEKAERDDIAIGIVTRGLKQLAKETGVPILLLVQANRGTDQAKRPTMSNLYGSSAIEADADLVLFAHRDEVANPETHLKGITELIPAKFRHADCSRTSYIARKRDEDGGAFYSLSDEEIGAIVNQIEADQREAKTKQRKFAKQGLDL